jgi:hypothetical protein
MIIIFLEIIERKTMAGEIPVDVQIIKEDYLYVAYCKRLNTSGYGKTIDEAKESFNISMNIFLDETIERGTLQQCLDEYGSDIKAEGRPVFKLNWINEVQDEK